MDELKTGKEPIFTVTTCYDEAAYFGAAAVNWEQSQKKKSTTMGYMAGFVLAIAIGYSLKLPMIATVALVAVAVFWLVPASLKAAAKRLGQQGIKGAREVPLDVRFLFYADHFNIADKFGTEDLPYTGFTRFVESNDYFFMYGKGAFMMRKADVVEPGTFPELRRFLTETTGKTCQVLAC
ncbi:MAG: YcxB family protein [Oscillospiraceae bacterium]